MRHTRFENLTETTGIPVSEEGASMMYTRYAHAAAMIDGMRVLEIGCGSGQGFGLLAKRAKFLVGGDYSRVLLKSGRDHYGTRVPLVCLSADSLPFKNGAFDAVLFFEALYYVRDADAAFDELTKVLTPRGHVFFVNANPERPDFISSPHAHHYHTALEFIRALETRGFEVHVLGAFPLDRDSGAGRSPTVRAIESTLRTILSKLGLVPRTLRGRARLKRLLPGRLIELPAELPEGFAPVSDAQPLMPDQASRFKVLYVHGHKRDRAPH